MVIFQMKDKKEEHYFSSWCFAKHVFSLVSSLWETGYTHANEGLDKHIKACLTPELPGGYNVNDGPMKISHLRHR